MVNAVGSTIARETDAGVYIHAGPEIGVASTKAFTSQITVLTLMTLLLGRQRDLSLEQGRSLIGELQSVPDKVERILGESDQIRGLAEKYCHHDNFLYLGRGINFPVALEGALKLKEISYIHAEGYSGSELKHGPLALIDGDILNICMVDKNFHPEKTMSNIEEIRARGGKVILITNYTRHDLSNKIYDRLISVETGENKFITAMIFNVVGQLLSYHFALHNDRNVDLPRNLAKSVTVE